MRSWCSSQNVLLHVPAGAAATCAIGLCDGTHDSEYHVHRHVVGMVNKIGGWLQTRSVSDEEMPANDGIGRIVVLSPDRH